MKQPYEVRYPHLFAPLEVGGRRLKNRIITAPSNHTHIVGEGNRVNEEAVLYYGGKAKGARLWSRWGRRGWTRRTAWPI